MKKSAIILIAAIVILAVGVTSTIAWFTFTTPTLTNTFTVGKVDITLTEDIRVQNSLLVPGAAIIKDPTVTVLADSEKCYVFVKIETTTDLESVIEYSIDTSIWTLLTGYSNIWFRIVEKPESNILLRVLTNNQVTVPTTVVKEDLAPIDTLDSMKITAYAIQYDYLSDTGGSVNDAEGAWKILFPTP